MKTSVDAICCHCMREMKRQGIPDCTENLEENWKNEMAEKDAQIREVGINFLAVPLQFIRCLFVNIFHSVQF